MTEIYHRDFNNPKDVSLCLQKKYDKIVPAELHFKDTGCEYNLQLRNAHEPMKYNGGGKPILIGCPDFQRYLKDTQISRIVVHRESGRYSIAFWQNDNITVDILCSDVMGLP